MNLAGQEIKIPENTRLNLTLIGPGFGESLIIHIGNNYWVIVDSCRNFDGESAPLRFLDDLNVASERVLRIIITHWHDDHIRGITNIVNKYKNAQIYISGILQKREILALLYNQRKNPLISSKGVEEIFNVLKNGKERLNIAVENCTIFNSEVESITLPFSTKIYSISPSSSAVIKSQEKLTHFFSYGRKRNAVPDFSPNWASIALFIEIGKEKIILGADLEDCDNEDIGWKAFIKNNKVVNGKSSFFKIPHHGSKNGFNDQIWATFLSKNPFCGMTPCKIGKTTLPTKEGISLLKSKSNNCYITSFPNKVRYKIKNRTSRKILKHLGYDDKNMYSLEYPKGLLNFKKEINGGNDFTVTCINEATKI